MATIRQALNRTVASLIPSISALVVERDRLRAENSRLGHETDRLTADNNKLLNELAEARDSPYDDRGEIANAVGGGRHREIVGGLWEQVGNLQFEFLASHGLEPTQHLLDIGCGSLRGGVRFAAYLEPGHYWGIDSNQSLLDAGRAIELAQAGLSDRVPSANLLCDHEFRFARFGRTFDVAIAQSLFTHLSANRIKLCLNQLAAVLKPGGLLFATYFEVDEHHPFSEACVHPHGVRTWAFKDPFHYPISAFKWLLDGEPWQLTWTGEWDHPRDQRMAILERLADE